MKDVRPFDESEMFLPEPDTEKYVEYQETEEEK